MKTNHPDLISGQATLDDLDAPIEEHRAERAVMTTEFEKLENDKATISELMHVVRHKLGLSRTRGQKLSEQQFAARRTMKLAHEAIDRNMGNLQVKVPTPPGDGPPELDFIAGTARAVATSMGLTIQEVIQHAGGTIKWDDLSVTFAESST